MDLEGFLSVMAPFVAEGLERGEAVFVGARRDLLEALAGRVREGRGLRLVDTREWHPHPARRLRAFHELAARALDGGPRAVRLVGEPLWPAAQPDLVREWERYESALNAVLARHRVTLVCLYDRTLVPPAVLATMGRTHPEVWTEAGREPSERYEDPRRFLLEWGFELGPPPPHAASAPPRVDLPALRRFVARRARRVGVDPARVADLVLAVNEVASNAVVHGGGISRLLVWEEPAWFVCEVEDRGPGIADPLVSYLPPPPTRSGGAGCGSPASLWTSSSWSRRGTGCGFGCRWRPGATGGRSVPPQRGPGEARPGLRRTP